MTEKDNNSRNFHQVDPDDYYNYAEGFEKKGAGGGGKGKKTLKALKKEQRDQSREKRRAEVENALLKVFEGFPSDDNPEMKLKYLDRYLMWIVSNLKRFAPLDPSELEITFSKSGGPGGQNINKRETRVTLVHLPTNLQVENDQTRSQLQNRDYAMEVLRMNLQAHLGDWKEYLAPGMILDLDLMRYLLEKSAKI